MMVEKKFQKKLNKEDHKKVDDRAKNVRIISKTGGPLFVIGVAAIKLIPKVIKTLTKT